jgi:hypothetical protein
VQPDRDGLVAGDLPREGGQAAGTRRGVAASGQVGRASHGHLDDAVGIGLRESAQGRSANRAAVATGMRRQPGMLAARPFSSSASLRRVAVTSSQSILIASM